MKIRLCWFTWLLCLFAINVLANYAYAASDNKDYKYVINLASSVKPISSVSPLNKSLGGYFYYRLTLKSNVKYRYRLRLGFFKSRKETDAALKLVRDQYSDAWIDTVKSEENHLISKWQKRTIAKIPDERRLIDLMEQARIAMVAKQYKKAISLYTKVVQSNSPAFQQEAQEYLGVARERNGQLAHAKAEYNIYLKKYPDSENIDRVKQRLNALLTAYAVPGKALKENGKVIKKPEWQHFGVLMQFYDRDEIDTERFGSIVANSTVSTNFNYNARLLNSEYNIKTEVAGTHIYDLEDTDNNDSRLTSMFADIFSPNQKLYSRVGRQKGRSGGVVGRFDGVDLGYWLSPKYKMRFTSGFPVEYSSTVDSATDKYFYSLGLDIGQIRPLWDLNIFMLQQVADGIVDRNEIGAEVRYRGPSSSLFSMLDYSVEFSTVNYFTTIYNQRFEDASTLDVIFDYRKTPFLTTTNALQGQTGYSSLGDLLVDLTEEEIQALSIDRTSLYKSLTVLHTRKLSKTLEFNADASVSSLSGTVASGGVEAIEGTGNEYSASAGLIANNLFTEFDINIMNFRFSQLDQSDVMMLNLSSKYRLSNAWRLNPRFRYEIRDYDDGRDITRIKPSIRVNYRRSRNWQFELQFDWEDKDTDSSTLSESETSYYLHAGYIYLF